MWKPKIDVDELLKQCRDSGLTKEEIITSWETGIHNIYSDLLNIQRIKMTTTHRTKDDLRYESELVRKLITWQEELKIIKEML